MRDKRLLFVFATPRTGSFLLCDLLHASGLFSPVHEFATLDDECLWRGVHGCSSYGEYISKIDRCIADIDSFCLKFMGWQFHYLLQLIQSGESVVTPGLRATISGWEFDVLQLRRVDRMAQAVSFAAATSSGIWSSRDTKLDAPVDVSDADLIRAWTVIQRDYQFYENLSHRFGRYFPTLWYEEWAIAGTGLIDHLPQGVDWPQLLLQGQHRQRMQLRNSALLHARLCELIEIDSTSNRPPNAAPRPVLTW